MAELKQIHLHGNLKELYQDDIYLAVDSVAEAVRGLIYQIPDFAKTLRQGHYRIYLDNEEDQIDEETLWFQIGKAQNIHIEPVLEGAKGSGVGKIAAGIALVGLSLAMPAAGGVLLGSAGATTVNSAALGAMLPGVFISSAFVGNIGVALALSGIASLLTPDVKSQSPAEFERPEERASYLFRGVVNTTEEGGPVFLVYGRFLAGSHVISTGLKVEQI